MFTRIFLLTLISSIILTFDAIDISKRFFSIPKSDGEISAELNITKIKQNLELNGFVLIPGKDMKNLLIQHGPGVWIHPSSSPHRPAACHAPSTGECDASFLSYSSSQFSELLSPRAPEHDGQHHLHGGHPRHHPVPSHRDRLGGGGRSQDCLQEV